MEKKRIHRVFLKLPSAPWSIGGLFSRKRETCPVKHPQKLFIKGLVVRRLSSCNFMAKKMED